MLFILGGLRVWICTQVHVGGLQTVGVRNVLVDGVQDFLLHLADGVAVEDLHLDLWAFLILWMDTVHHLLQKQTPEGQISPQNLPVKGFMGIQWGKHSVWHPLLILQTLGKGWLVFMLMRIAPQTHTQWNWNNLEFAEGLVRALLEIHRGNGSSLRASKEMQYVSWIDEQ